MKQQCNTAAQCLKDKTFQDNLLVYVKEKITYVKETGEFYWKVKSNRNGANAGDKVGHLDNKGYLRTRILNRNIRLHRLAWFICHGKFPCNHIDHINRVKTDNRIQNLRDVTPDINATNKYNKTNELYIYHSNSKVNPFIVRVRVDGKRNHIGVFNSLPEAVKARDNALSQACKTALENLK